MRKGKGRGHEGHRLRPRTLLWASALSSVLVSCALSLPSDAAQDISGIGPFFGVACPSSAHCLGVGSNAPLTVGESAALDGTTGTLSSGQAARTALGIGPMSGVACASATLCLGVGSDNSLAGQVVSMDPATGQVTSGQSEHDIPGISLLGVSCPSPSQCLAVGGDGPNAGAAVPLDPATGLISSGQSLQNPPGVSFLSAVACASPTQCLAVGEDSGGNQADVPLNPATGTISSGKAVTDISGIEDGIFGVACPTTALCVAVGLHTFDMAGDMEGVAVPLNLSTGAAISAPEPILGLDSPSAVTCASSTQCLAVGQNSASASGVAAPIDPTTGAISSGQSAHTVSGTAKLQGAACPTSRLCMAVGQDSNDNGVTALLSPATGTLPTPYTPLAPVRICDSRPVSSFVLANQCDSGAGNPVGPISAGGTKTINVANGTDGVPADATAVVLNVTAVLPSAPGGFMTVYPAGASQPNASNLNYPTGETVPNLVQVGVGVGGDVSFASSDQTDLIVDVEGFTAPGPDPGAGLYNALPAPARLCDTRAPSSFTPPNQCDGPGLEPGTLVANGPKNVTVTNGGSIPTGATAAVLNVTVANPATSGFLTAYPQGSSPPIASNLNFGAGQTTTNRVIVPLSANGKISLVSSTRTNAIVDVSGYYSGGPSGTGAEFSPEVAPVRICDTRAVASFSPQNQCSGKHLASGSANALSLQVTNGVGVNDGVPADATAVVVNLTGILPSASTFLTVFPGPTVPASSDLNPAAGETRANLVVATVNHSTGKISVFNNTGSLDVIVDVLGWYSASAG
jgi:hypothetical protein